MESTASSVQATYGTRRGQRESSYHPMASDSGSEESVSDGDPPDYAGGPRPAPIAPPPTLGAGGAPKKRSFDELEDIVFSNPKSFVALAKDIADARNVPLLVGDDRTHKISSAYMHVHCAYRRAGCPFIIKLTKAKEGGWLIRGSKASELDTKQRSNYRCRHPAGSKPDLSAGTSLAAWLSKAERSTSHPEAGARPKAAKARSASGPVAALLDEAQEESSAGRAPRAGSSRAPRGNGASASAGRMGGASNGGAGGIEPERALAPPFQRAIDLQAQIVPALSPRQQLAYLGGGVGPAYSPHGGYTGADGYRVGPTPTQVRGAGPSPPQAARLPLVSAADPSALPDWTALLTLLGDGDLLPLARVLASPLVACTPASFFAEPRDARGKLLEALPAESTGLWPKIKLARRLGGDEGERAWAQMRDEREGVRGSAGGSGAATSEGGSSPPPVRRFAATKEEPVEGEHGGTQGEVAEQTPAPTTKAATAPQPPAGFSAPQGPSPNEMDVDPAPVPVASTLGAPVSAASALSPAPPPASAPGLIVATPPRQLQQ